MLARTYKLAVGIGEPTVCGIPLDEAVMDSMIFGDTESVKDLQKIDRLAKRASRLRDRQTARYNMIDDVSNQIRPIAQPVP